MYQISHCCVGSDTLKNSSGFCTVIPWGRSISRGQVLNLVKQSSWQKLLRGWYWIIILQNFPNSMTHQRLCWTYLMIYIMKYLALLHLIFEKIFHCSESFHTVFFLKLLRCASQHCLKLNLQFSYELFIFHLKQTISEFLKYIFFSLRLL